MCPEGFASQASPSGRFWELLLAFASSRSPADVFVRTFIDGQRFGLSLCVQVWTPRCSGWGMRTIVRSRVGTHTTPIEHPADRLSAGAGMALVHALALAAAAALVVITAPSARWDPGELAIIATFAVMSDLTNVEITTKLRVSGSFLGLMLAAVLLGGGPAALVGVLTIAVGWLRSREAPHYLRNNLVTYAWFPLCTGLLFHSLINAAHLGPRALGYYLLVFAAFAFAMVLNFVAIAGYQCHLDGTSLLAKVREALAPIVASQLFSALLTLFAVYLAVSLGTVGLALFGLVLVIFQYLVGQLLVSKRRSEDLQRMATTDELTGLANRERFRTRLAEEIETSGNEPFAVMLMDLDRFKEINDTLGHHYGDELLSRLGARLARCVGPVGLVARLGGDEFAVLPSRRTDDATALEQLAHDVLACVQEPIIVDELTLEVGASVGIARFPRDGRDANSLLRRADVAMYRAKEAQTGSKLYETEHDHHSLRRLSVITDVRRALGSGQVVVHYQPKIDLQDHRVRGAEALVRWQHPKLGLLAPSAFIDVVEQTGLIGPLTRHVLQLALAQCAAWRRVGEDLSVAVNLSVRNLLDHDLSRDIEALLNAHDLPPDALELEITESMIMSDPERALATLGRLSKLGVGLSVDDFGTGYSSLANLRRLPIDELKIDRSFVSPMLRDESDLIIVRSTINLGHDLGLKVIAEGVEDEPTLERLAVLGCDLAQGYHLSRPLPSEAFNAYLFEQAERIAAAARMLRDGGALELERASRTRPGVGAPSAQAPLAR
jgi:diguanylate cyclase (GGDEF)-like protein